MIKLNLKNKSYLLSITFLLFSGCGGGSSSLNGDNNTVSLNHSESNFKELSAEEQETLTLLSTNQQALLDAINMERSQTRTCGNKGTFGPVHALTWNPSLYASALEHATDLAISDTFSHDGSGTESDITGDGRTSKFYERIVANGYSNYYSIGENIAGGQRSLTQVMHDWMASPGHCVNIMKSTYTEVGIAIVINQSSTYQIYWTQNFGSKQG
jgi:uncharacterized protein YkwD